MTDDKIVARLQVKVLPQYRAAILQAARQNQAADPCGAETRLRERTVPKRLFLRSPLAAKGVRFAEELIVTKLLGLGSQ